MKIKFELFLLSALALFNSCGIYSRYERPKDLPLQGLYRDSTQTEDTTSIASLTWRQLFTDAKLTALIEEGLKNNTDLQKALLQTEEAEATLQQSKAAILPSLSLSSEGKLSSFNGKSPQKTYSLGVSASWESEALGTLRNNREQSKAALQQAKAYTQAVQTKLIATIADDYYSLLLLDRQLEITDSTKNTWKENLKAKRVMMQAGRINEAEVNQAEANYQSAEHTSLKLKQQIYEQENSLAALIGSVPQTIERDRIDNQHFPSDLSVGVPLNLLSKRPDVLQKEYELEQYFYDVNKARAAFYPSLTLSGTAGWTNSGGVAITDPGKLLLTAIGSIAQPLFNRKRNVTNLKIAKAQQQEALLSYSQAILDAGTEVNNALRQWQTALKKEETDRKQIEQLTLAVKNTRLLMANGTTNYLDVLNAEQNLLNAKLSAVSDQQDEIEGIIYLYHALGGGKE